MEKKRVSIKKLVRLFIGLTLLSMGIVLFIRANLGVDPITAMNQGVAKLLSVTIGQASQIVMGVLILMMLFLDRKRLGIGTLIHAIFVGIEVDFLLGLGFPQVASVGISVLILLVGLVVLSLGLTVYITANLGEGAIDAVMIWIVNKTNIEVRYIRISLDVLFTVFGFSLGSPIGIGTLVGVALTGPLINFFLKKLHQPKHQEAVASN